MDGLVLHQILQWHHMLTATGDHPADTVAGLEANTLADGLYHAATWVFVVAGIVVLRRAWAAGRPAPTVSAQLGGVLAGWGIFNLVEGLVDHHLLGVHDVRDDVADPLWWNLGFLAFGALLVAMGSRSCVDVHGGPLGRRRTAPAEPRRRDGGVHRRQPGKARAVVKDPVGSCGGSHEPRRCDHEAFA